MTSVLPVSQPCQTCGTSQEKTFTCVQCNNLAFCDPCWPKWVLHTPGSVGWGGKPHEKADPIVVHRLRQILEPARTEAEHEFELLEDEDTTWFGFDRDPSGQPVFYDYGRFAAIMGESLTRETADRFPQLVSFIGETGAGKSTLIKLLIDRQDVSTLEGCKYCSPVTSSNYDRIPTTGDVHLYADPATFFSATPMLLADCEGLSGGEAMPKQLRHHSQDLMSRARMLPPAPSGERSPSSASDYRRFLKSRHSSQRTIAWAKTPQTRKREFAVSQLYPRILYTFSDAVVFVLRNPRAFESTVLEKLLRWGAASIDKSLNQPVLPHAIIVLNATENVSDKEWDVSTATDMLMSDISGAIHREPALQEHVRMWRKRGRIIANTGELLECYYASISVIRIPYKGSYMLMDQQVDRLTELIRERCSASHWSKKQVRMLATAEKLQVYLSAAYDHFTKDLDTPFDFVQEALRHSPAPRNFEGNILSLALTIKHVSRNEALREDGKQIFLAMTPMIASCVLLDAVRQNLLGTATRLLDERYAKSCVGALQVFADMYWPCSFWNPTFGDLGRCCNVRSGHNPKGHQNAQGKIIGNGTYQSNLDPSIFAPEWMQLIRTSLTALQSTMFKLGQSFTGRTDLNVASILHRERINDFYSRLGRATDFISHSACLSCLRELPECALPCGHVLCLPCMDIYGQRTSRTSIEISRCPLHVQDVIANPPWMITTKPAHAGIRVLCLDGGGVRGIVQLQVLKAIERILGPGLPVQLFFDLIVGTNTGGVIGIGLGVKKWTVDASIEKFKDLFKEAFTPREMANVPLFGALSKLYHGSLYKTQPFEKALKRYFSATPFFGGARSRHGFNTSIKVSVTASKALHQQAVVFANYNRPDPSHKKLPYHFIRSDVPSKELRMWEAARATSAASPFFKPFLKPETSDEYVDSALQHRCPAVVAHYEAKLIWRDVAGSPPDVVLSIATGKNVGDRAESSIPRSSQSISGASQSLSVAGTATTSTSGPGSRTTVSSGQIVRSGRGGAGNYKRAATATSSEYDSGQKTSGSGYFVRDPKTPLLISLQTPQGVNRLYDHKQCDETWSKFMASGLVPEGDRQRYLRVCPELFSKIPKFDDIQKIDELEREAEQVIQQNIGNIREVAHRLVASSFFFEKQAGSIKQTPSGYTCLGSIFCRFRQSSSELQSLGGFLRSRLIDGFEPYFLLEEDATRRPARQIMLKDALLQDVSLRGQFHVDPIRLNVAEENSETKICLCLQSYPYSSGVTALPISGFPRRLMSEDGSNSTSEHSASLSKRASNIETSALTERPGTLSPDSVLSSTVSSATSLGSPGKLSPLLQDVKDIEVVAELPDHATQAAELPAD